MEETRKPIPRTKRGTPDVLAVIPRTAWKESIDLTPTDPDERRELDKIIRAMFAGER